MIYKKYAALFIVPLIVVCSVTDVAQARSRPVPVITPEPIEYRSASISEVGNRIRKVLVKRRWLVKRVNNTHIRASYEKHSNKQSVMASVNILYDGGKIRLSYHDSEGFDYDKSSGTIHRRYNSWVRNIYRDLLVEFGDY